MLNVHELQVYPGAGHFVLGGCLIDGRHLVHVVDDVSASVVAMVMLDVVIVVRQEGCGGTGSHSNVLFS